MLRVSLLGNLGADPEPRFSQKGTALTSFRVAANQARVTPEGDRQESTEWFRVRTAGRLADFAQRLGKGARVLVVGRLEISHYQSREGEARVGFDIWADEVVNLSGRAQDVGGEELLSGASDGPRAEPMGAVPATTVTERASAPGAKHGPRGVSAKAVARRPALIAAGTRHEPTAAERQREDDLPF